jgi:uncharacterized protein YjcR
MNADKIFREFLRELYIEKEFISSQKGNWHDPSAPWRIDYTWKDVCEEIGISSPTVNNWLRTFTWEDDTQHNRPSVPPGIAAAVWWLSKRKEKTKEEKSKPAQKPKRRGA